jgi:putative transposase
LRRFSFSGVEVVDNLDFKISTAVDIREFKLDPKDGLRVNERRYWCNALATRESRSSKFQVRLDPEDPYVVYALINGAWHQCHANGAEQFSHLTLAERLSHATRMLEGRELHRKVREECQQEFTRKLLNVDEAREASRAEAPPTLPEPSPSPLERSLFDQVRDLSVDPPTGEPQEVSVYALDRIRHR